MSNLVACDLNALDASERERHAELVRLLISGVREKCGVENGYRYRVDLTQAPLLKLAEWIELERRCCPFLEFEVVVSGTDETAWLTLQGSEGTRELLDTLKVGEETGSASPGLAPLFPIRAV